MGRCDGSPYVVEAKSHALGVPRHRAIEQSRIEAMEAVEIGNPLRERSFA